MKRLTERYKNYVRVNGLRSLYCIEEPDEMLSMGKAISRLAAYEDTELMPEEIIKALKTLDLFIEATKGIPINRIRELVQAEQDGRLVVLPPVKIGDTAFFIINNHIFGGEVYFMRWEHHKSFGIRGYISADCVVGAVSANLFDFGKTVFLTREEAESALKGGAE